MKLNTKLLHEQQFHVKVPETVEPVTMSHISPIYQTSTFTHPGFDEAVYVNQNLDKGYIDYTRQDNPNLDELGKKMAALEHTEASQGFASGMGAISSAIMSCIKAGDNVVAPDCVYGCTFAMLTKILPNIGVTVTFVDMSNLEMVAAAIKPNTSLVYIETPSNPTLKCTDIEEVCKIAHEHEGIKVICDSTFASPYFQTAADYGVDIVCESATKYLCGHGTVLAGTLSTTKEHMAKIKQPFLQCYGAVLDPFAAWLLMQGLKTLGARMPIHASNAMKLATYLENHPKVSRVYYPGLESHPTHAIAKKQMKGGYSGMMSVDIVGGIDSVKKVVNNLHVFSLATSLGTVDSLVQHSPTMSHFDMTAEERANAEIFDNQLRLSVGLEDIDDIIEDFEQALALI